MAAPDEDLQELQAFEVERILLGGRATYAELWRFYGVKRGWLDMVIQAGKVPPPSPQDDTYDLPIILKLLAHGQVMPAAHPMARWGRY
jgi:hypothetical protein